MKFLTSRIVISIYICIVISLVDFQENCFLASMCTTAVRDVSCFQRRCISAVASHCALPPRPPTFHSGERARREIPGENRRRSERASERTSGRAIAGENEKRLSSTWIGSGAEKRASGGKESSTRAEASACVLLHCLLMVITKFALRFRSPSSSLYPFPSRRPHSRNCSNTRSFSRAHSPALQNHAETRTTTP